jgi:hypothetical protein
VPDGSDYTQLLVARWSVEQIGTNGDLISDAYKRPPGRRPPLLDGAGILITTAGKDSIWNEDLIPLKPVWSAGGFRGKERAVTINGTAYRFEEARIEDVIRLLEHPTGKEPLHRIYPPLAGAEQTARALRLLLREQLLADAAKK